MKPQHDIILAIVRVCFRKAERACGMDKRGHFLVNLRQTPNINPEKACTFRFLGVKNVQKNLRRTFRVANVRNKCQD